VKVLFFIELKRRNLFIEQTKPDILPKLKRNMLKIKVVNFEFTVNAAYVV
jgi:hypothetical protein